MEATLRRVVYFYVHSCSSMGASGTCITLGFVIHVNSREIRSNQESRGYSGSFFMMKKSGKDFE